MITETNCRGAHLGWKALGQVTGCGSYEHPTEKALDDKTCGNPRQVVGEKVGRRHETTDHSSDHHRPAPANAIGEPAPERNDTYEIGKQNRCRNKRRRKFEFRLQPSRK